MVGSLIHDNAFSHHLCTRSNYINKGGDQNKLTFKKYFPMTALIRRIAKLSNLFYGYPFVVPVCIWVPLCSTCVHMGTPL